MGVLPFALQVPDDASPAYKQFWQLWREGRYFECHEVLEELWRATDKATQSEQRLFYNGLIHGAVALYQHYRGNATGAARQLVRAQVKLRHFQPEYFGVDVEGLLSAVEYAITPSLEVLGDKQRAQLAILRQTLERRI